MISSLLERKLNSLTLPLSIVLPNGHRIGASAPVTVRLQELSPLTNIASGNIGKIAQDYVEGRLDFDGNVRDLMAIAAQLISKNPAHAKVALNWCKIWLKNISSRVQHNINADAEQIQFHYDVSDEFYKLWLDPMQLYSCAYFNEPGIELAEAQQAKLDHICRKLMLKPGERFLDIGAGWGGLLILAVERYGVEAHGITLSRNQYTHVNQLIKERGLTGRMKMELLDYRELPEDTLYDKIASVGMFEHVGRAQMPAYFAKIHRLLKPGGLLMNHGITASNIHHIKLGSGLGNFIERNIFPGGELLHISKAIEIMSGAQLEPLDIENLRPHYARTLWAWSDALENNLGAARKHASEKIIRAYRFYLAGCAMSFEQGWIALFQMLATKSTGEVVDLPMRGAQSVYPFNRSYMYE